MKDDWVPINCPENLDEMIENWANSSLLCNNGIRTEADLIPGTSTHNCEAGRALEKQIALEQSQTRRGRRSLLV